MRIIRGLNKLPLPWKEYHFFKLLSVNFIGNPSLRFKRENTENITRTNVKFKGDSEEKLTDINITPKLVRKHLLKLKRNKSPGPDTIGSSLLLDICDYISEPLSLIFNMSIHLKQVPTDWKHANVTPIFKKGDKSDPGNYRPISLTSQICKVLESILRDNVVNHLNTHALLLKSQHGFTEGKSCLTNLLSFLEDATKATDESKPLDVIYLDFSKAFDKVPHKRLLHTIESHGIKGNVAAWIGEWLCDRKQQQIFKITGCFIGCAPRLCPWTDTCFIFVNDIDTVVSSHIQKFADDCKFYRPVPTAEDIDILQQDINNLCQWSKDWQMLFNVKKCKVLHIGHNNKYCDYSMNGEIYNLLQKRLT